MLCLLSSHKIFFDQQDELEGSAAVTPVDWAKNSQPDEYYINECDEHDHKDRNINNEIRPQKFIASS